MTANDSDTFTYTYDEASRLDVVKRAGAPEADYTYDLAGRRVTTFCATGIASYYYYDRAGRLLTLINDGSTFIYSKFEYSYDNVGNRTHMTYSYNGTPIHIADISYGYDDVYRLTSEQRTNTLDDGAYSQSFIYDNLGNRLTKQVSGSTFSELPNGTWTYSYNELNQLLTENDGSAVTDYEYDLNGSLTKKKKGTEASNYGYDDRNRMVFVDVPSPTGYTYTYTYDSLNRRVKKALNGIDLGERYLYDGDDVLVDYSLSNGQLAKTANYNTPVLDGNLSVKKFSEQGEALYYYMTDGLGSIRNILKSNGVPEKRLDYDAWGVNLQAPSGMFDRYNFTGREYDAETHLHYYRARYYDSNKGRFISLDKSFHNNRYKYCQNNPISFVDPTGEDENNIHFIDENDIPDLNSKEQIAEFVKKAMKMREDILKSTVDREKVYSDSDGAKPSIYEQNTKKEVQHLLNDPMWCFCCRFILAQYSDNKYNFTVNNKQARKDVQDMCDSLLKNAKRIKEIHEKIMQDEIARVEAKKQKEKEIKIEIVELENRLKSEKESLDNLIKEKNRYNDLLKQWGSVDRLQQDLSNTQKVINNVRRNLNPYTLAVKRHKAAFALIGLDLFDQMIKKGSISGNVNEIIPDPKVPLKGGPGMMGPNVEHPAVKEYLEMEKFMETVGEGLAILEEDKRTIIDNLHFLKTFDMKETNKMIDDKSKDIKEIEEKIKKLKSEVRDPNAA
jgi:RHS repeat-associated protein